MKIFRFWVSPGKIRYLFKLGSTFTCSKYFQQIEAARPPQHERLETEKNAQIPNNFSFTWASPSCTNSVSVSKCSAATLFPVSSLFLKTAPLLICPTDWVWLFNPKTWYQRSSCKLKLFANCPNVMLSLCGQKLFKTASCSPNHCESIITDFCFYLIIINDFESLFE